MLFRSVVDSVYNCRSFSDTLCTFMRDTIERATGSSPIISDKVNGVDVYYDAFSGRFWRSLKDAVNTVSGEFLSSFGSFANNVDRFSRIHQVHIRALLFFFYLFSTYLFFYFCQKYLPLEHDFESEEGHFLPILEGVKYLPNPHILHFSVK